jgi:glycosyltransferase involved in cell wall biosynthesis
MRILHVVPTYLPATRYGGPIYSVHGLCKALVELGHEVNVLTTNVDGDTNSPVPLGERVAMDGVGVWYYPVPTLRRLYFSPAMAAALPQHIASSDVVHVNSVFLWPTSAAARVAKLQHKPYIVAPRGMLVPELIEERSKWVKKAWLLSVERETLRHAARVHVTSRAEYADAERVGLQLAPMEVVPNGIDVPGLSAEPSDVATAATAPYVLFLGRLCWTKGIHVLLEALAGTDMRLILAGPEEDGYRHTLAKLIAQHGLADRARWIGSVGATQKWTLLRGARCLVLPSVKESFGNVVVEAMAVGCPVVVTEGVGASDIVQRANAGRVSLHDAHALRAHILKLWNEPDLARSLGENGARYARAHLTWPRVAEQMAEVYRGFV